MTGARARRLLSLLHYGLTDAEERDCRLLLVNTDWGNADLAYEAATRLEEITDIPSALWIAAGNDADEDHKAFKEKKALGKVVTGRMYCRESNFREVEREPRAVRTGTWPEEVD